MKYFKIKRIEYLYHKLCYLVEEEQEIASGLRYGSTSHAHRDSISAVESTASN